jgi:C1A family cysteine protease
MRHRVKTIQARSNKRLGWVPDLPDHRDYLYAAPVAWLAKLPSKVDLRTQCPPVYDQGQLGSCTANAIAAAIEFDQMKQKMKYFMPSRLFVYYNERAMEGTIDSDSGAQIRDGIKSVNKQGDCPEKLWPYIVARFADKPSALCYTKGNKHKAVLYQRVNRVVNQMKGCLASGYPFVFGFSVYESFMNAAVAKNGHAVMPKPSETLEGGHAVLAVGYDDAHQWFMVRNSWGTSWGLKGYFTIPYAYLLDEHLSDDFWTIRAVT